MKLYLIPSACSLAAHIAVREANLDIELVKVDLRTRKLPDGTDYKSIAPKGQVAAMALESGDLLTENIAILVYLSSLAPESGLMPSVGTPEYFRTLEWLAFVSTEMHKQIFWTNFNPAAPQEYKKHILSLLPKRFDTLEERLKGRDYISSNCFSVADAYLTWALHMIELINVPINGWPTLEAYHTQMFNRPSVKLAMAFEAQ